MYRNSFFLSLVGLQKLNIFSEMRNFLRKSINQFFQSLFLSNFIFGLSIDYDEKFISYLHLLRIILYL